MLYYILQSSYKSCRTDKRREQTFLNKNKTAVSDYRITFLNYTVSIPIYKTIVTDKRQQ